MSFLSKKSWHARSTKNVAKVWQAEQNYEQEQRRIAQRLKELQKEHELEALRQLHAKASGQPLEETRIEWMYQDPTSVTEDRADREAYLLGKQVKDKSDDNLLKKTQESVGSLFAKADTSGPSDLDIRAKLRDDPLYTMMQREAEYMNQMNTASLKIQKLRQQRNKEEQRRADEERRSEKWEESSKRHKKRAVETERCHRDQFSDKHNRNFDDHRSFAPSRQHRERSPGSRPSLDKWSPRSHHRRERDSPRSPRRSHRYRRDEAHHRPSDRRHGHGSYSDDDDVDNVRLHSHARGRSYRPTPGRRDDYDPQEDRRQLDAMRQNAEQVHLNRKQLMQKLSDEHEREREQEIQRDRCQELQPQFISDMGKSVYTDPKLGSLEERLLSKKFYIQKNVDSSP
ncbi:uncharacterized protein LOC126315228 [Schistocerca gregaria]|uniref:uncharacterized protein LOC126315228 n=1 Tax=Schistocerca gregaria TaxID=7010 RepID=UPI00211DA638|nr:uncharacterized protein LOC126315228 [Schistocerca gregaria]